MQCFLQTRIKEARVNKWPDVVKQLAGAWQDLPSLEAIRHVQGKEAPRAAL